MAKAYKNNWKECEIRELFDALKTTKILLRNPEKKYLPIEAYKEVEEYLKEKGVERSAEQIRNKVKSFKCAYNKALNTGCNDFEYFDEIADILSDTNWRKPNNQSQNQNKIKDKDLELDLEDTTKKGVYKWTATEIDDLLEIIQTRFLHKISPIIKLRNTPTPIDVYYEIKSELDSYGHDKSVKQILKKWNRLCTMYKHGKNLYGGSVPKYGGRHFKYYPKMCEIFQSINNSSENGNDLDFDVVDEDNDEDDDDSGNSDNESYQNSPRKAPISSAFKEQSSTVDVEDISINFTSLQNNDHNNKINSLKREPSNSGNDTSEDPLDSDYSPTKNSTKKRKISNSETTGRLSFSKKDNCNESLTGLSINSYYKCVDYLIKKFKNTQMELQGQFYSQQLKLQKQQQEWEEKVLDEEREFFLKVMKSVKNSKNSENEV